MRDGWPDEWSMDEGWMAKREREGRERDREREREREREKEERMKGELAR